MSRSARRSLPVPPKGVSFLLFLTLAFAPACLGPVAGLYPPRLNEPTKSVWIVGHRLHTGIVFRHADIPATIWPESGDFRELTYLEVGWGDRDYYQAPRATVALALKAIFFSRGSVLHIIGFNAPIDELFPGTDIIGLELPQRGFEELCRFIHESYARTDRGDTIGLGHGASERSYFYLARGKYHVFNNCNNWAAKAIRSAGCPITPAYALTPRNVIAQASTFGRILRWIPSGSERDVHVQDGLPAGEPMPHRGDAGDRRVLPP